MKNPFTKISEPIRAANTFAIMACVIAVVALLAAIGRR